MKEKNNNLTSGKSRAPFPPPKSLIFDSYERNKKYLTRGKSIDPFPRPKCWIFDSCEKKKTWFDSEKNIVPVLTLKVSFLIHVKERKKKDFTCEKTIAPFLPLKVLLVSPLLLSWGILSYGVSLQTLTDIKFTGIM